MDVPIIQHTSTGSAIVVVEDITSGSSISLDGVETELVEILGELKANGSNIEKLLKLFEDNILYIEEQYDKRAEFFEKVEEWKDQFFEIFENFGNVSFDFLSIIGGILIALFLWFIIRLVYKLFRMFF